jgi:hypothetical protein
MLTIAWDVDDVLNDFMHDWLELGWRPRHPACHVTYGELRANPPHQVLGVSLSEFLGSLDDFRHTRFSELAPVPEALDWFRQHGDSYRHIALTAIPLDSAPLSAAWVMRHFGRWIRSFHLVPSARAHSDAPVYDRTKQDFLSWFEKATVLVDDHPGNINAARSLGIRATVMPRPWNGAPGTVASAFTELGSLS